MLAALLFGPFVYMFRHEFAYALAALAKIIVGLSSTTVTPDRAAEPGERALVAAFAPKACAAGSSFLVQVVLCSPALSVAAAKTAAEADPDTSPRGEKALDAEIRVGDAISIELAVHGHSVDEPFQTVIWDGSFKLCQFFVLVGASTSDGPIRCHVRVARNSVPIGSLKFVLQVRPNASPELAPMGDEAQRYRRAFLSYASQDRSEVLKRAQALNAVKITFFQDILSLDPGEQWEKRLNDEIDECDLFLLFWSSSARKSKWVMREVERALARRRTGKSGLPDITPVMLEGPPAPTPPDCDAGHSF